MKYYAFYSQYLELKEPPPNSKNKFWACKCIFHDDRKASAGVDVETGVFNCFGPCGTFSPAAFLQKLDPDLSYPEASALVDGFRRENGLIEKHETFSKVRSRDPRMDRLYQESLKENLETNELAQEYASSRGLTIATLAFNGIGFLPAARTHWNRDSLVFPYFFNGHVVGIRYRDKGGCKSGEPGCYFTIWGIDALDAGADSRIAIVVEGESDRLRTQQELGKTSFQGVVVSTPTSSFNKEWAREFDGYFRVVLITQADSASGKIIPLAHAALGEKLAVLNLPWRRKQVGKDVCDWFNYNTGEDLRILIESLVGDTSRRFMSGSDFSDMASEPRSFLINKLLARRQVCVVAGPPKAMKTWVMLAMIKSLITGTEFLGIPNMTGVGGARCLIIEEEGDAEEFKQRMDMVFADSTIDWREFVVIGHHLGVKFDSDTWVTEVENVINQHRIDAVFADPFQRLHSADENSASEQGPIWTNVHRLTTRFPRLGVVLLHHFNKTGDINLGWNAFRGSSRMAGEVDLGIFVERRPKSEANGAKLKFDGRSIPSIETPDGKDIFRLKFHERGGLSLDVGLAVDKRKTFLAETLLRPMGWTISEAAAYLGLDTTRIRSWVAAMKELRLQGDIILPAQ